MTGQDKTYIRQPDVLVLSGEGFGSTGVEVYLEDYECEVQSFNDTSITCALGYLLTEYYNIKVYVESKCFTHLLISGH